MMSYYKNYSNTMKAALDAISPQQANYQVWSLPQFDKDGNFIAPVYIGDTWSIEGPCMLPGKHEIREVFPDGRVAQANIISNDV